MTTGKTLDSDHDSSHCVRYRIVCAALCRCVSVPLVSVCVCEHAFLLPINYGLYHDGMRRTRRSLLCQSITNAVCLLRSLVVAAAAAIAVTAPRFEMSAANDLWIAQAVSAPAHTWPGRGAQAKIMPIIVSACLRVHASVYVSV